MDSLACVRIGQTAPDFHCSAVTQGLIDDVTISSYINEKKQWLILLFIPTAFSLIAKTEVLAFRGCLDVFEDRNCNVMFCSVNQSYTLWHWQNLPLRYGGLGQIEVTLLSDATRKMSRDYGVYMEEKGVCLRSMFVIDSNGIIRQVTHNPLLTVPSVHQALRLLDTAQAAAK
ncbi:AhpC/TSA family protein [Paraphaeosphaeria sporulosa]